MEDKVHFKDSVRVGVTRTPTAPENPCEVCGKETLPHHPVLDDDGEVVEERRICSNRLCRNVTTSAN